MHAFGVLALMRAIDVAHDMGDAGARNRSKRVPHAHRGIELHHLALAGRGLRAEGQAVAPLRLACRLDAEWDGRVQPARQLEEARGRPRLELELDFANGGAFAVGLDLAYVERALDVARAHSQGPHLALHVGHKYGRELAFLAMGRNQPAKLGILEGREIRAIPLDAALPLLPRHAALAARGLALDRLDALVPDLADPERHCLVSQLEAGRVVIGADQVLDRGRALLERAKNRVAPEALHMLRCDRELEFDLLVHPGSGAVGSSALIISPTHHPANSCPPGAMDSTRGGPIHTISSWLR